MTKRRSKRREREHKYDSREYLYPEIKHPIQTTKSVEEYAPDWSVVYPRLFLEQTNLLLPDCSSIFGAFSLVFVIFLKLFVLHRWPKIFEN